VTEKRGKLPTAFRVFYEGGNRQPITYIQDFVLDYY
jgi:hypothetical protein